MKITLVVLFVAALTIYCKCAAVLSLPPSFIAHAASLDESLKAEKPFAGKDNESQLQMLAKAAEARPSEAALAADLYTNFENLWHNDLSLSLQKREKRNTFDDGIGDVGALQQQQPAMAAIKKNNQNQNGLQPHDSNSDNVAHKNYNHNNNKNEQNILKSSAFPVLYSLSSATANLNEALNSNWHTQPQWEVPSNKWPSSSPEMIEDIFISPPHQMPESPQYLKRRELENLPFATAATAQVSPFLNRFSKSTKHVSRPCPGGNGNSCAQTQYGALIADRKNALLNQLEYTQSYPYTGADNNAVVKPNNNLNDDDIVLLLTAEKKLIQFLSWALSELYPPGKFTNVSEHAADSYHPDMYIWKKLNLSGRLEPPLLVDEPHYVKVRRDYDPDDDDETYFKRGLNYGQVPFIPPRGRKHDLPDLDSLLQRYETFVPNRGRRDKIKDIFKYDDLFYPNRGKRQMTIAANDNGDTDERSGDIDIADNEINQRYYNNEQNSERDEMQEPFLPNELLEYIENLIAQIKRKLQQPKQKIANIFDEMSNRNEKAAGMSTTMQQAPPAVAPASLPLLKKRLKSMINILQNRKNPYQQHLPNHYNARRQWWKRYAAAEVSSPQPANDNDRAMPTIRSPTMATDRLQKTLKSMSSPQQRAQFYQQLQADLSPPHLRPDNKFMLQQQQMSLKSLAQQFDPLSWHKLQLLLQPQQQLLQSYHHSHNQPLLTMRHPRLTALQHLPAIKQQTPQETQLPYSYDQLDNSITNDLDNIYNKDLE